MSFEESIKLGYAKEIKPNKNRAQALHLSSKEALKTALEIELKNHTSKTILRELYESLRELCEAIGYKKGYKFSSHESITHFLISFLNQKNQGIKFDRYRKLRNDINYYGKQINKETVIKARIEIPEIYKELESEL